MKTIFLLLLFSLPCYSQNYIELFYNDIPDNIHDDNVLRNSLETNLEGYIKLNPQLIYFTLSFYQQYENQKFNTDLFEELKSNARIWFTLKSEWASKVLEEIKQSGNKDIIYTVESSLEKLQNNVRMKNKDKLSELNDSEKQERDFYIVKYYNKNSSLMFNENTDYSSIRMQIEDSKKEYFKKLMNNPGVISSPSEIIDYLTGNWYLFIDDPELKASEFLMSTLPYILEDNSRRKFSLSLGYIFVNNTLNFEESFNFPGIGHTVNLNKSSSFSEYLISLGYKLYLSNNPSIFSYLNIQLYYALGYSDISGEEEVLYSNSLVSGNSRTDENLRNFENSYKLSSFNSYGLKLSFPLYEYNFLTVEAGCNFDFTHYLFKPDMYFTYSKYRTDFNESGQPIFRETLVSGAQIIKTEIKKNYFSVIPTIDLSFNIIKGFGVKACTGYNYLNVNFTYNTVLL